MVVTFIQGNALKVTFNTMSHVYNELTHLLRYLRFFVLEEVFTMIYQFNFVEVFLKGQFGSGNLDYGMVSDSLQSIAYLVMTHVAQLKQTCVIIYKLIIKIL